MANHLCLSDICAKCLWWQALTEEYTSPKSSSPGEPQSPSLRSESTFRLCFFYLRISSHAMQVRYANCSSFYALRVLPHSLLCGHANKDPLSLRSFEMKPSAACKKSELTHILLCCFFSLSKSFPLCFGEILQDFMVEARAMCWEALHVWTQFGKIAVPLSLKWSPVWRLQLFTGAVFTFTKLWKQSLVTAWYTDTAQ